MALFFSFMASAQMPTIAEVSSDPKPVFDSFTQKTLVTLVVRYVRGNEVIYQNPFCSGSVIHPRLILTAAHCRLDLAIPNSPPLPPVTSVSDIGKRYVPNDVQFQMFAVWDIAINPLRGSRWIPLESWSLDPRYLHQRVVQYDRAMISLSESLPAGWPVVQLSAKSRQGWRSAVRSCGSAWNGFSGLNQCNEMAVFNFDWTNSRENQDATVREEDFNNKELLPLIVVRGRHFTTASSGGPIFSAENPNLQIGIVARSDFEAHTKVHHALGGWVNTILSVDPQNPLRFLNPQVRVLSQPRISRDSGWFKQAQASLLK